MGGLGAVGVALLVLAGIVLLVGVLGAASMAGHPVKRSPDAPRGYRPYPRLQKSRRPRR